MRKDLDIQKTIDSLTANRMQVFRVKDRAEAKQLVKDLVAPGASVAFGGSVTLHDCGIDELLQNGDYVFYDRHKPGASEDEIFEIHKQIKGCDYYLTSSNAITETGLLYNVDGIGNRVSAMIHGPRNVIVVAGVNKIVPDLDAAIARNRNVSAPLNAKRVGADTPCAQAGVCCDCESEQRICCAYVVLGLQRFKDRIKVILVEEQLGY